VEIAARRAQLLANVERHQLVAKARGRKPGAELAHAAGREADLFLAFADRARFRIFAGFERAGRQLPDPFADHVAVLPDEDDAILRRHRDEHHRTPMPDNLHRRRLAIGQRDVFALEPQNAAGIDHFFHS